MQEEFRGMQEEFALLKGEFPLIKARIPERKDEFLGMKAKFISPQTEFLTIQARFRSAQTCLSITRMNCPASRRDSADLRQSFSHVGRPSFQESLREVMQGVCCSLCVFPTQVLGNGAMHITLGFAHCVHE